MNKLTILILLALFFAGCNSGNQYTNDMENTENPTANSETANDTTPRVTGIGGIFFFSDDPGKTREWYSKNLGLEVNEYGSSF
ncbi:MAG: hypothetical protein Q8M08_14915 [Bacteroidales bacterium]|nr:hypothetical protein [Bacteroidales bacterium]